MSLGPVLFGNELGIYALAALIPFFLLYLIRPRPKQLDIPSVMFLFRQAGVAKYTKFFRNFIRDWVFLIQLLAFLCLIGILMSPFFWYDHDVTSQNTVVVLDASASSQVWEGSQQRFDIAKDKARDVLGSSNTVILAKEVPLIALQDAGSLEASSYINSLEPRDSPTRLGDAIILAGEVLSGKEGRVVVLSDFVNTGGQDPETAKLVLESKGLTVDFINTAEENHQNVGFVDANIDNDVSLLYVKNFATDTRSVTVSLAGASETQDISAGEVLPFAFQTPTGVTEVTLEPKDSFMLDNKMSIAGPAEVLTRVLIISNNNSVFLENAIRANTFVEVEVATPPIVPTADFDVYVLHNLNPDELLPGTLEDISEKVEDGATVIVHAQPNMVEIDYKGLFPYEVEDFTPDGPLIIEQSTQYTRDIQFGSVNGALLLSGGESMTTIASTSDSPVLSIGPYGDGKIVYMGMLEEMTDFRFSTGYPIFWHELFKFLTDQVDVSQLNYKTGRTLILDGIQTVETPVDTVRQASILLDYEGTYKYGSRTIVANLLSEEESAINPGDSVGQSAKQYELVPVKEQREYDLEIPLALVAAAILFLELLFIKFRGDL